MSENSFGARADLEVGGRSYEIYRLDALQETFDVARLPFSLKILLENLLRNEDGVAVRKQDIEALATWDHNAEPSKEIAFTPGARGDAGLHRRAGGRRPRRDARRDGRLGGDPTKINPLVPAELVIDHSVQVDAFGTRDSLRINAEREYERNEERYALPALGPDGVRGLRRRPARRSASSTRSTSSTSPASCSRTTGVLYPDTLVGTDSHTTMINGLGVLGWGVGGIEAEAAMLGQAMSMLIPRVVGFKLGGELPEGATATDLVLTVTQMLREHGVVGKFVEFYGPGVPNTAAGRPRDDRQHEPGVRLDLRDLPDRRRDAALHGVHRPLEGADRDRRGLRREQGLWHDEHSEEPTYSETLELDLGDVVPSLAGPKRPQDRVALTESKAAFRGALEEILPTRSPSPRERRDRRRRGGRGVVPGVRPAVAQRQRHRHRRLRAGRAAAPAACRSPSARSTTSTLTMEDGTETELDHGHVVIAAITSCTNTSNPSVMIAAGLLAKNAVERGLQSKPWVKTSLAPGSKVVMEYYDKAGLVDSLEALGFHLVGYGCTTCIGNSGPLPEEVSSVVNAEDLAVVSVLSGNRNFEGRINPDVKMNYLASPPLVVAYALAGTMDIDLLDEPLGQGDDGADVYLKDIWPSAEEVARRRRGVRARGDVPVLLRPGLRGRRALEGVGDPRGRPLRLGRRLDLRAPALVPGGRAQGAVARRATSRARACWPSSATRSPPTTSPRRARSRRARRRRSTSTSTASSRRTSTPTARAAATTR